MKNINKTIIVILTAIMLFGLQGCVEEAGTNNELLQRLPDGDFFVMSFQPGQMIASGFITHFVDSLVPLQKIMDESEKFEEHTGIKPENIARVTLFAKELKGTDDAFGVFVQGKDIEPNLEEFMYYSEAEITEITIEGFNVKKFTHTRIRTDRDDDIKDAYFYFDNEEILAAGSESIMSELLTLKRGSGRNMSDNSEFRRKFNQLGTKTSSWFYVPTDEIMDDVLEKVRERNPQFNGEILQITTLLGGLSITDDVSFILQAYNDNDEQRQLLFDTLYGLRGMGLLGLLQFPDVQRIFKKIEVNETNGRIEVGGSITIDDINTISQTKLINPRMRKR